MSSEGRGTATPHRDSEPALANLPGAPAQPGTDGPIADSLLNLGRFLRRGEVSADLRTVFLKGGLMGATAISVRAAAGILALGQAAPSPLLVEMHSFLVGLSVVLWSFGTWFIPLLVLFGLWRYFIRGYSWAYKPKLWSVVFPLGMYTVASVTLGRTANLGFMTTLAEGWVWVGVAAWVAVVFLMLLALARAR